MFQSFSFICINEESIDETQKQAFSVNHYSSKYLTNLFLQLSDAIQDLASHEIIHGNLTEECIIVLTRQYSIKLRANSFTMSDYLHYIPRFEPNLSYRPPEVHILTYAATLKRKEIQNTDVAFVLQEIGLSHDQSLFTFFQKQLVGLPTENAWWKACELWGKHTWDHYALAQMFVSKLGIQCLSKALANNPSKRQRVLFTDLMNQTKKT